MPRNSSTPSVDSRSLDIAKGILIAFRGCTPEEAFAELTAISRKHSLGTLTLARALVQLTGGTGAAAAGPATDVAVQTWGNLVDRARSTAALA